MSAAALHAKYPQEIKNRKYEEVCGSSLTSPTGATRWNVVYSIIFWLFRLMQIQVEAGWRVCSCAHKVFFVLFFCGGFFVPGPDCVPGCARNSGLRRWTGGALLTQAHPLSAFSCCCYLVSQVLRRCCSGATGANSFLCVQRLCGSIWLTTPPPHRTPPLPHFTCCIHLNRPLLWSWTAHWACLLGFLNWLHVAFLASPQFTCMRYTCTVLFVTLTLSEHVDQCCKVYVWSAELSLFPFSCELAGVLGGGLSRYVSVQHVCTCSKPIGRCVQLRCAQLWSCKMRLGMPEGSEK